MPIPSRLDVEYLALIRENIKRFMSEVSSRYAGSQECVKHLLDIAPQDHEGARPFFPAHIKIDTLDIDPDSNATFIADLCKNNSVLIKADSYDFVVCTEVLEHTLRPFDAVNEIQRVLKKGGYVFLTVPLNFRIHGPLPDCWRFTEHGLKAILSEFSIVEIQALEAPARPLMPIHYTVVAQTK